MWDIKLKATNKENKQKLIDTGNSTVVTRGKGVGGVKGEGGQICGDGR